MMAGNIKATYKEKIYIMDFLLKSKICSIT